MADYADGTPHAVTGTGIVAVASPAGLRWNVTARPLYLGSRPGSPTTYLQMGRFALGDSAAFGVDLELQHTAQLVYPLVNGVTRVGYTLETGVSATLTELVSTIPNVGKSPYDRNPAPVGAYQLYWNPASTPQTSGWTYTVPAGRRLQLASARVIHIRVGATPASSINTVDARIDLVGGVALCRAFLSFQLAMSRDDMLGPLWLPAGAQLAAFYGNSETASGVYTTLEFSGTLFDA